MVKCRERVFYLQVSIVFLGVPAPCVGSPRRMYPRLKSGGCRYFPSRVQRFQNKIPVYYNVVSTKWFLIVIEKLN